MYRCSATAFSQQPSKVGTTIIPIFQIQKLRLREVKESAHGSMMPWCSTPWCFSMAFLNLAQPTLVEGYFLMWRAILCIVGCLASLASFHYSWPLGTILSQNKNFKITPLIARYSLGTNHPWLSTTACHPLYLDSSSPLSTWWSPIPALGPDSEVIFSRRLSGSFELDVGRGRWGICLHHKI